MEAAVDEEIFIDTEREAAYTPKESWPAGRCREITVPCASCRDTMN